MKKCNTPTPYTNQDPLSPTTNDPLTPFLGSLLFTEGLECPDFNEEELNKIIDELKSDSSPDVAQPERGFTNEELDEIMEELNGNEAQCIRSAPHADIRKKKWPQSRQINMENIMENIKELLWEQLSPSLFIEEKKHYGLYSTEIGKSLALKLRSYTKLWDEIGIKGLRKKNFEETYIIKMDIKTYKQWLENKSSDTSSEYTASNTQNQETSPLSNIHPFYQPYFFPAGLMPTISYPYAPVSSIFSYNVFFAPPPQLPPSLPGNNPYSLFGSQSSIQHTPSPEQKTIIILD